MISSIVTSLFVPSLLLGPTIAPLPSPQSPPQPLTLQWMEYGGSAWNAGTVPIGDRFIRLRVSGNSDAFEGAWLELVGRVHFHPSLWDAGGALESDGLPGGDGHFNGFHELTGGEQLSGSTMLEVGELEEQEVAWMPDCSVGLPLVEVTFGLNGINPPNDPIVNMVQERSIPMLDATGLARRIWDLDFSQWTETRKDYWSRVSGHRDQSDVIAVDALIKRIILNQLPESYTPGFFTENLWRDIREAGDVTLNLQVVSMRDKNLAADAAADTDDDTPPDLGTLVIGSVSTGLSTNYINWGISTPEPVSYVPVPSATQVYSGQQVSIRVDGLGPDMGCWWQFDGSPDLTYLPFSAGATVMEALVTLPMAARGVTGRIVAFQESNLMIPIPFGLQYIFVFLN